LIATLLLFIAALPAATARDAARPQDRATIDACMQRQKDNPQRCITAVFKPCTEAP